MRPFAWQYASGLRYNELPPEVVQRAAESGVLAASLAADGFTGPRSVLEGEAGS